ncbi:MAG: hypothetical protein GY940_42145, partial [bacterium]|nr:hypothetical protein [bacterium]
MRYLISILISLSIICLSTLSAYGQELEFQWIKGGIGPMQQNTAGITIDRQQNIIISGDFQRYIKFGTTVINAGSGGGVFVAKFDRDGNVIWSRKATGPTTALKWGSDVTTDAANNIVLVGAYNDRITFDSITLPVGGWGHEGY